MLLSAVFKYTIHTARGLELFAWGMTLFHHFKRFSTVILKSSALVFWWHDSYKIKPCDALDKLFFFIIQDYPDVCKVSLIFGTMVLCSTTFSRQHWFSSRLCLEKYIFPSFPYSVITYNNNLCKSDRSFY